MIRMINQTRDGYADAYTEAEAAYLEAKGWARFEPAAKGDAHIGLIKATIENAFPILATPARRGRPPKADK